MEKLKGEQYIAADEDDRRRAMERLDEVCGERGIKIITHDYPMKKCVTYIPGILQVIASCNCKGKHISLMIDYLISL